ncbi:MAG: GAF domain-containing protein [Actinomycetota bacterium]
MDEVRGKRIIEAIGPGGQPHGAPYPERVCLAGVELLGGSGVGLTLVTDSEPRAAWASDAQTQVLEDLHLTLGEGPGLDAFRLRAPALEANLAEPSAKWPFFRQHALGLGVRAVFSFPVQVGSLCLGALNVFRTEPRALSCRELADALVLANVAAQEIVALHAQGVLQPHLHDGAAARCRVHQACGMVAVQIDADLASAMACMRSYAFVHGISIFRVADEVTGRRLCLRVQDPAAAQEVGRRGRRLKGEGDGANPAASW